MDLRERALEAYEIESAAQHNCDRIRATERVRELFEAESVISGEDLMIPAPGPDCVWADGFWFRMGGDGLVVQVLEDNWVRVQSLVQLGSIIKHAEYLEANKEEEDKHRARLHEMEVLPDAIKELLGMHPDLRVYRVEGG